MTSLSWSRDGLIGHGVVPLRAGETDEEDTLLIEGWRCFRRRRGLSSREPRGADGATRDRVR